MLIFRQMNPKNFMTKRGKYSIKSLNCSISHGKTRKYNFSDNVICASFNNDVILSASGQTKMDSIASCLSLVRDDFIVY